MPGRYFRPLDCCMNLFHLHGLLSIQSYYGLPIRFSVSLNHTSQEILLKIELDSFIPCGYHFCTSLGYFLLSIVI